MKSTENRRSLSRRQFLRQATAALALPAVGGAWLAGSRRVRAATPSGPGEKIHVALIGSGGMGRGDLSAFLQNPDVECSVICDVDEKQMAQGVQLVEKQRGYRPDTVKDFRQILERRDVDAVLVATPDHWHALPTVYACQAGKDVYVEKPLATSIAEGRAMLEAAQRHQRIVQMGTQWRSGVHFKEAVEFIQSGKLGKVRLVRCWAYHDWLGSIGNPPDAEPPAGVDYDFWLGPAPKRPFNPNRFHFNFRWFWDYAGGLMTDWGVHLLNIALWAMGPEPPRTVSSTGGKQVLADNSETPDTQITVYEFSTYTLIWEHQVGCGIGPNGRPWGLWFSGTEGTLILNDAGWEVLAEPKRARLENVKNKGGPDARPAHVRDFLDCVRSRRPPAENLELGHFVSTVAHLGNIAYRTGKKIVWDAPQERIPNDSDADRLVGVPYRAPWKLPYLRRT